MGPTCYLNYGPYGYTVKTRNVWVVSLNHLDYIFWEKIKPDDTIEYPCPRIQHATVFHNGKIYLFGGKTRQNRLNDLWMLDPINFTWKRIRTYGSPPSPRFGHLMMGCGHNLFVFGGYSPKFDSITENLPQDVIKLNLNTFEWSLDQQELDYLPLIPHGRFNTSGIVYCKNRLLIFGGLVQQEYEKSQSLKRTNDVWILEFDSPQVEDPNVMILGTYVLKRVLGSDTFGEIYLATHETELEDYSLRRIKIKGKETNAQELMDYIGNFARVNHANFAKIISSWLSIRNGEKSIAIVTTLHSEGSLIDFFKKFHSILTERDLMNCICQILAGLSHLHALDLVHKDLNPNSIYVNKEIKENEITHKEDPYLIYKISNFGFEKSKENRSFSILSQKTYNAPESDVSSRKESDLWNVGLLIYFILTNESPPVNPYTFAQNSKAQLEKLENGLKRTSLKKIRRYHALILKCVRLVPEERSTAAELFEEFNILLQSLPSSSDSSFLTKTSTLSSTPKSLNDVFVDDDVLGGSFLTLQNIGRSSSTSTSISDKNFAKRFSSKK